MRPRSSSSLFATVSPLVLAALLPACGAGPMDVEGSPEGESLAVRVEAATNPPKGLVLVAPASLAGDYRGFEMPIGGDPLPAPALKGFAFRRGFAGGVNVAAGDVNGDGVVDIVVGAATGSGRVRVLDSKTGKEVLGLRPFGKTYEGGVSVAAGDVNGDGRADVIISGGGRLRVVDVNGRIVLDTTPFEGHTGGVSVAAGDLNGDGFADVVAAANPAGGRPHVKVFDGQSGQAVATSFPFEASYVGGVNVAVGDINGDGLADIVVGAATGPIQVGTFICPSDAPVRAGDLLVNVLEGCDTAIGTDGGIWRTTLDAPDDGSAAIGSANGGVWKSVDSGKTWSSANASGVNVAAGDINNDGFDDVVIGAANGAAHVKVIDGTRLSAETTAAGAGVLFDFLAYDLTFSGGVTVAATPL